MKRWQPPVPSAQHLYGCSTKRPPRQQAREVPCPAPGLDFVFCHPTSAPRARTRFGSDSAGPPGSPDARAAPRRVTLVTFVPRKPPFPEPLRHGRDLPPDDCRTSGFAVVSAIMRQRRIARLTLSALLIIQLAVSPIVTASPRSTGTPATAHGHAAHCTHQVQSSATGAPADHATPADGPAHHDSSGAHGCCAHDACTSHCGGAVFVGADISLASPVLPDHPAVITFAPPRFSSRAVEFFRPPI